MAHDPVAKHKGSHARVEEVVADCGVRAYLVREHTVPFVSLALHVQGGAALDPAPQAGLANMVASVLDEGAGPYDSDAFRAALEDNAIRLGFDADRDGFSGDLRTLNTTRDLAFDLLRLALTEPRFDEEPVERIRAQLQADLMRRQSDPDHRVAAAWFSAAFGQDPYGRPVRGTAETIAAIGRSDLLQFARSRITRDTLSIGVAGDIQPGELKLLLDRTFGGLPASLDRAALPAVAPVLGQTIVVPMPVPQSVVMFGTTGIDRKHPDHYGAMIANYLLGGGGFSSRLMEEVREKRGLAYSVYSYLYDTERSPLWMGGVATSNEKVAQSIALVRQEVARMAAGDFGQRELDDAKTYLTGSFPLRLTSNDQIAKMLVGMLLYDLGIDFLDRRNGYIEAVSLADLKRVCAKLFSGELLVTIAGAPEGIQS